MKKVASSFWALKVLKAQNTIIKNLDLVPKFIKTFNLLPKNEFDLLSKLTETFDLVI